jgi:hypothetical protein
VHQAGQEVLQLLVDGLVLTRLGQVAGIGHAI